MHKRIFLKNNLLAMTTAVIFGVLSQISVLLIAIIPLFLLFQFSSLSLTTLIVLGSLVPTLGLFRPFFRFLEQYFNHLVAFRILENYRLVLFKELKSTDLNVLAETYRSDFLTVLTKDIETLELFFAHTISPFFISLTLESVVLIAGFFVSPFLVLTIFGAHVFVIFIYFLFYKLSKKKFSETRGLFKNLTKVIFQKTQVLRSIYMFAQTNKVKTEITLNSNQLNQKNVSVNVLIESKMIVATALMTALTVLIAVFAKTIFRSTFDTNFAPILFYSTLFLVFSLSQLFEQYALVEAANQRVKKIFNLPKEDKVDTKDDFVFDSLNFNLVNFEYQKDKPVIKDLSFDVKIGEIIGISGRSGVGKSTLVKLITGFIKPTGGEITFKQNLNIKDINTKSLYQNVSVLFQDEHIFKDTLRYNLTLGNPDIKDSDIIKAINQTGLVEFFEKHNSNLNLKLTPNHLNVSTGEKFRIGLCRAILKNSGLIVLDEPTRFLDPENEEKVLKIIESLKTSHAFLLITHRPKPFLICDKIINLN